MLLIFEFCTEAAENGTGWRFYMFVCDMRARRDMLDKGRRKHLAVSWEFMGLAQRIRLRLLETTSK